MEHHSCSTISHYELMATTSKSLYVERSGTRIVNEVAMGLGGCMSTICMHLQCVFCDSCFLKILATLFWSAIRENVLTVLPEEARYEVLPPD